MTLDDMIAGLKREPLRTLSIDVTEFTGPVPGPDGVDGPNIWRYEELTVAEQFAMLQNAELIRADNPTWPLTLCQSISALAAGHRFPESKAPPGRLYAQIAEKSPKLFALVAGAFMQAFAGTVDLPEAGEQAKNACGTASPE